MSTLGDKKGEHWVIHAHVFPVHVEKGELNIYSSKHIAKMEENLTARAKSTQYDSQSSVKSSDGKNIPTIHNCSGSSGRDNTSSKDSNSTGSVVGGISSNELDDEAGPGRQSEGSGTSQYFGSK